MANTADSEAHFEERAVSYGVPRNILRNFKDAGIRTLAHMAFGMGRPGQDFDETAFSTWIRQVIGQDCSNPLVNCCISARLSVNINCSGLLVSHKHGE